MLSFPHEAGQVVTKHLPPPWFVSIVRQPRCVSPRNGIGYNNMWCVVTRITASSFRFSSIHKYGSFIRMYIPLNEGRRKSHIDQGNIYFWTATINKWYRLLERDEYKDVIIQSLQYLTDTGKIDVYAFIIMPNHIHLIWRINEPNGKESPQGSLLKYTALQKIDL